ncbi:Spy/CpxP family protein refolding chaperone [Microvirga sp. W0021]|uniref:Spy/CpxP family protein refolding chaperone n=1 Tax=Hohaiivirga grylli TaxID=3133970 RepID=A0ABV0BMH1_9HYPH
MKKFATLTAAAALLAMSGTVAYAQTEDATDKGPSVQTERMSKKIDWKAKRADMQAYAEARLAGVPAGLKLTADQQKLWAPVETALKDNMKARSDFMDKMREARKDSKERPDFMQRLETRADMSQQMAEGSKKLLDAMKPLWASLDDGQKKLLPQLLRPFEMQHGPRKPGMHKQGGPRHEGHRAGPHRAL